MVLYGGLYGQTQSDLEYREAEEAVSELERKYNVLKPQVEALENAVKNVDDEPKAGVCAGSSTNSAQFSLTCVRSLEQHGRRATRCSRKTRNHRRSNMGLFDEVCQLVKEDLLRGRGTSSIDAQAAGMEAAQLTSAAWTFWVTRDERLAQQPPPKPSCGNPLQDEINEVERLLNLKRSVLDDIKQRARPLLLDLKSGAKGMGRVSIQEALRDLRPEIEAAQAEVDLLTARHAALLAKRQEQEREDASCGVAKTPPQRRS